MKLGSRFCRMRRKDAPLQASLSCQEYWKHVRPRKRVLPGELEASAVSGKRVLRTALLQSSISAARFLDPKVCALRMGSSARQLRQSAASGAVNSRARMTFEFAHCLRCRCISNSCRTGHPGFRCLSSFSTEPAALWTPSNNGRTSAAGLGCGEWREIPNQISRFGPRIAKAWRFAAKSKRCLAFRTQHAGMLYSFVQNAILGHVTVVKRDTKSASGIRIGG